MQFPRKLIRVGDCLALAKQERFTGVETDEPWDYGRPQLTHDGEFWRAPRLSYHLNIAPIPRTPESRKEGLVLHSCDNGWCVEPGHLSLGTAQRNMQEKWERNPGIKERRSKLSKRQWADPEFRKKVMDGKRGLI